MSKIKRIRRWLKGKPWRLDSGSRSGITAWKRRVDSRSRSGMTPMDSGSSSGMTTLGPGSQSGMTVQRRRKRRGRSVLILIQESRG